MKGFRGDWRDHKRAQQVRLGVGGGRREFYEWNTRDEGISEIRGLESRSGRASERSVTDQSGAEARPLRAGIGAISWSWIWGPRPGTGGANYPKR